MQTMMVDPSIMMSDFFSELEADPVMTESLDANYDYERENEHENGTGSCGYSSDVDNSFKCPIIVRLRWR